MTRAELLTLTTENAGRLNAKLEQAILEGRGDEACRWADALCATIASVTDLTSEDDE